MARPRKKITKRPVNLTIDPTVAEQASRLAYHQNESLSEMVERLLRGEIAAERQVAETQAAYPSLPTAEEVLQDALRKAENRDANQAAAGRDPSSKSS